MARAQLSDLVGATVIATDYVDETGCAVDEKDLRARYRATPILSLRAKDGRKLIAVVLCDPEGNGPGFLSIERV